MPQIGWKTLTVSQETWNRLGKIAKRQHRSRNMVILELIEKYEEMTKGDKS